MSEEILKYDSPSDEKGGKMFAAAFAFLPMTGIIFYFIYKAILWIDFIKMFNEGQYIMLLIYIFGAIMVPFSSYVIWREIIELGINCYTIELQEKEVVGFTAFKKRKEIAYEDIYYIIKQKGGKNFQSMRLQDKEKKTKLIVHWGMNSYGECVETIRKRAVNVKVVDYGGIDENHEVWEKSDKSYHS